MIVRAKQIDSKLKLYLKVQGDIISIVENISFSRTAVEPLEIPLSSSGFYIYERFTLQGVGRFAFYMERRLPCNVLHRDLKTVRDHSVITTQKKRRQFMIKKIVPVFAVILALSCPLTAFADEQNPQPGTEATYSGGITVISADNYQNAGEAYTGPQYYPVEIKTVTEDGEKLIVKTFEVPDDVNPQQLVEPKLERGGILYEARDILKRTIPGGDDTRQASKTVTIESKSKDMAEIMKQLDPYVDYSEAGYAGQLLLDPNSILTDANGYSSYKYPVTEVRELMVPDRNDTAYIPKTASKNGVELSLSNVNWTTMGYGQAGNGIAPNLFSATAEYVGYATGRAATGYTVTATYAGEISRKAAGVNIVSIIYSVAPGFDVVEAPVIDISGKQPLGAMPFIIMACVIVIGAAGTAFILWIRRRGPIPADGVPVTGQKKKIFMPRSMDPGRDGDE